MSEIIDKEVEVSKKMNYEEFEKWQLIIPVAIGQKIKVQQLDTDDKVLYEKIFISKYINSHLNCQWQDKGVKSAEPLYEYKLVRKT